MTQLTCRLSGATNFPCTISGVNVRFSVPCRYHTSSTMKRQL